MLNSYAQLCMALKNGALEYKSLWMQTPMASDDIENSMRVMQMGAPA
jgi:hypothetical protein